MPVVYAGNKRCTYFNHAINAIQHAYGGYLILHEENAFGKILCYRWKP